MNWALYEPEGNNYIAIDKWGKDHWSTFAYLETRVVDDGGRIDNTKMRCNPRLHRELANMSLGRVIDGSKYYTRLQGGIEIENHDDWSCVEDMAAAGLVLVEFRQKNSGEFFKQSEARARLTDTGKQIAGMLRAHKADGKTFSNFVVTAEELAVIEESIKDFVELAE